MDTEDNTIYYLLDTHNDHVMSKVADNMEISFKDWFKNMDDSKLADILSDFMLTDNASRKEAFDIFRNYGVITMLVEMVKYLEFRYIKEIMDGNILTQSERDEINNEFGDD